ncbi:MAG: protein kinase [Planctomycetota bacterium JB042]
MDGSARDDEAREAKERVAEALRILEDEGRAAFDRFVDARPDLAADVRRRVRELSRLGLLVGGAAGEPDEIGRRVGPYRLLERIGTGGMGVVYLAEHVELGRRVALKTLPHRAVASDRARERFLRESRAVAQLDHPCIVPIYEVGEEDGAPWFAMRFVPGRTLADVIGGLTRSGVPTAELRSRHLSRLLRGDAIDAPEDDAAPPPARARPAADLLPPARGKTYVEMVCRLVHDVAEALEHAHSNGVLHRDVKPSNVLVTEDGRARLFDFGLADVENEASLTLTKEFVGTPYYVSPEQIAGEPGETDARADIYSLGVTLFELLTLRLPFRGKTTQQVLRQIQSREPPFPRRLNPLVPRDLETICLTAMEKAPERRYRRAGDLAADLRRFLEFRPIEARPVGAITRALRFARRHRAASIAAALGVLLVVGVPIALVLVNLRIERERVAAERAFTFLEQVVFESDAEEAGGDATLETVIERAGERVRTELTDSPRARARLLTRIGAFFNTETDLALAERYLEEGVAAWLELRGEEDPETATALNHFANTRHAQGRADEAVRLYRRAAAAFTATRGEEHDDTLMVLGNLAGFLTEHARLDEASELLDRIERAHRRRPEVDELALTLTLLRKARVLYRRGLLDESAAVYRDAIDRMEHQPETPGRQAGDAWGGWARVRLASGHLDDAERGYRRQLEVYREVFGADSTFVAASKVFLGEVAAARGEIDEAVRMIDEGAARYGEALGPLHPWTLEFRTLAAKSLRRAGRLDAAEARFRALAALTDDEDGGPPSLRQSFRLGLAMVHAERGESDDALAAVDEAVALARASLADEPEDLVRQLDWLATTVLEQGFEALAARIDEGRDPAGE